MIINDYWFKSLMQQQITTTGGFIVASKPWPNIHNQIEFQEHIFILEKEAFWLFPVGQSTPGLFPPKYFEVVGLYLKLVYSLNLPHISRSLTNQFSLLPLPVVL